MNDSWKNGLRICPLTPEQAQAILAVSICNHMDPVEGKPGHFSSYTKPLTEADDRGFITFKQLEAILDKKQNGFIELGKELYKAVFPPERINHILGCDNLFLEPHTPIPEKAGNIFDADKMRAIARGEYQAPVQKVAVGR